MKIAIGMLCVLVGALAYFAYVAPVNVRENQANSWFRVREPVPIAVDQTDIDLRAVAAVAKKPLFINGKEVVLSKQDQWTISHAMARASR